MQVDQDSVIKSVFRAIDSLNMTLPSQKRINKSPNTILMGKNGELDSLSMVNLIVETEMMVEEDFGRLVNLADQSAAAHASNVFETVSTFANYIEEQLNN